MTAEYDSLQAALQCGRASCECQRGPNRHCPAHEDAHPSLTIHQADTGKILLHCKTGCSQADVVAAIKAKGLWGQPAPRAHQKTTGETPVATYEYRDILGNLVACKGRFEYAEGRKSFKWRMPGDKAWGGLQGLTIAEVPLWGTEMLHSHPNSKPIFLVEGEKAAQACRDKGLCALTHGGGASTTNFGTCLQILKGHSVVLWPDNDGPGRTFMARLHTALRPIAKNITIITPPLPEKGDAWDYFATGGLADTLLTGVPVVEPGIDYLGYDSIRVRMPSATGTIHVTFSSMEKTSRELSCEIEVSLEGGGEPFSQRLNMLSGSQVTEMRRTLDAIFGKDLGWPQIVNTAIAKARKAFMEQDRATRLIDIPEAGLPQFLIPELLPEGVPTVWFGNGSSLKTYMALRAAISVAGGYDFMGLPVTKGAAMLVDYENPAETFKFRCFRLFTGMNLQAEPDLPLFHWPARGIPLADQIEAIRAKVQKDGITMIAIDSGAAACGGKPEDADVALAYFMALQKLGPGVTTLTIAHCSKGSDEMMPFGSVFWHNQPRRTVNFARTDDEDSDDIDIGVYYRKVNDGKKPKSRAFHIRFEGEIGPVSIAPARIEDVPELNEKRSMRQQAWDVLSKPMTAEAILGAIGIEVTPKAVKSLRATMTRDKRSFTVVEPGIGPGQKATYARVCKPC